MPADTEKLGTLTELVYFGRRRWSPEALDGVRRQLIEMRLPDLPENFPAAAHEILQKELRYVELMVEHLQEMNAIMDRIVMTNGTQVIVTKLLRDDYDRFFDDFLALGDLTKRMIGNWPRFLQASAIRVPGEGTGK